MTPRASPPLKRALEPYVLGGPFGALLDAEGEALGEDRIQAFETEGLVGTAAAPPVLAYLFHRIETRLDGSPTLILVDEGWLALDDPAFGDQLREWLKTLRKKNVAVVFATQSLADVEASSIAASLIELCPSRIFLPNAHAAERDYVEGFGLTRREFALVREDLAPESRQFLIKQGLNSVVAELRLDGLDDELAILSGRTETVDLLDRIRARVGDDPAQWLEPFHQERRLLP